ncbi:hypothetical protein [Rhizobium paknamense]|uniref:Uncharacterized protein n=1 Tax=Rhizobium paknamense TaxID=1206817 RepID=A0ABU0IFE6_9HYPH|nr:hypothetical protein [Rhizobium paknamense]MDQ0455976.1 hypothetical protein [Rhizobium paknamense]
MSNNENFREFGAETEGGRYNPRSGLSPLHEAAIRLADFGINKPRSKTKELMTLLLCHGARAFRYSQPEASIHLHVAPHSRRLPVKLRLR